MKWYCVYELETPHGSRAAIINESHGRKPAARRYVERDAAGEVTRIRRYTWHASKQEARQHIKEVSI